jgi:MFS family permease
VIAAQRRAIAQLFAAAAAGSSGFYGFVTVGPLIALELTGSRAWSGLPSTCTVLGAAVGAALIAGLMSRAGRRAGLRVGFGLGATGGALAVTGALAERFTLFLAAAALIGMAHGANLLSRFAAADMVAPERRGAALGTVLAAGTIGALVGPNLARAAAPLGLANQGGGLLLVALSFSIALAVVSLMRTDPSALAADAAPPADLPAASPTGLWRAPHVVLALVALVLGQAAMILLMTVTPVHVHDAGHGVGTVGLVMAAHFVGMFALSPVIGWLVPRAGAQAIILAGMAILIAATTGAAIAPHGSILFLWLFLLGLGWSCSYVSGSALLCRDLEPAARARLQGAVDAIVWMVSAAISLLAGIGLEYIGYHGIAAVGAALSAGPVAFVVARRVRAWNHARG